MKLASRLFFALLVISTIVSCKKDKAEPAFKIEGGWTGKIGNGPGEPDGFYLVDIKKGGVIERIAFNGNVSAKGTWSVSGNEFNASYTFIPVGGTVTVKGIINKTELRITGTWENTGSEDGKFYLVKNDK
ncbi:MAG: hypothetical protein H7Y31_12575 [Chitinophagaceae bacterium]|nr:hypothetical protein [Chitinophagaceae bacterium]